MQTSRIAVIGVALAAGLAAALLVSTNNRPPPAPQIVQQAPEIQYEEILVAASPIGIGTFIDSSHLHWVPWPAESIPEGVYIRSQNADRASELIGQVMNAQLFPGDPVREDHLYAPSGNYMATVLGPDRRAVSIPIDPLSSAGGFVLPGDRVDIILVQVAGAAGNSFEAKTVMENVLVLAIDTTTAGDTDEKALPGAQIATFEVSSAQADLVARLPQMGAVVLALRGSRDSSGLGREARILLKSKTIKTVKYGVVSNVTVE